MKRLSTFFPLIIMALLAAASFWLEYVVSSEIRSGYGKDRHDPDAIVQNFSVERFDKNGTLRSRMQAAKLTHYPDTDTADIDAPRLGFLRDDSITTFRSDTALADNRQNTLLMLGKVIGERPARPGAPAQTLNTEEMTIWSDDEIARTPQVIRFTQGNSQFEALGADWNNLTGVLNLHSHVQATLQPHPSTP